MLSSSKYMAITMKSSNTLRQAQGDYIFLFFFTPRSVVLLINLETK